MLRKLFALSAVVATVVAFSSDVEAGKCRTKRNRRCCRQNHCQVSVCPAPCNVCNTPAVEAAPAAEAPAVEAAPEPPAEKK
ncbi:hypothetical protein Pan44_47320 [Caulifigura coniformis]|uniref:Uncharacterized protein n=1 Tax=Caulifigura coniformis TaxID=2527983 RepID=A0A517SKM2_9PLAN|nr:hypothetical protein [Caulifigura coniformis]QDT56675.1 hypothetical protein Pan44_47320 [Caulifigura coniformis]